MGTAAAPPHLLIKSLDSREAISLMCPGKQQPTFHCSSSLPNAQQAAFIPKEKLSESMSPHQSQGSVGGWEQRVVCGQYRQQSADSIDQLPYRVSRPDGEELYLRYGENGTDTRQKRVNLNSHLDEVNGSSRSYQQQYRVYPAAEPCQSQSGSCPRQRADASETRSNCHPHASDLGQSFVNATESQQTCAENHAFSESNHDDSALSVSSTAECIPASGGHRHSAPEAPTSVSAQTPPKLSGSGATSIPNVSSSSSYHQRNHEASMSSSNNAQPHHQPTFSNSLLEFDEFRQYIVPPPVVTVNDKLTKLKPNNNNMRRNPGGGSAPNSSFYHQPEQYLIPNFQADGKQTADLPVPAALSPARRCLASRPFGTEYNLTRPGGLGSDASNMRQICVSGVASGTGATSKRRTSSPDTRAHAAKLRDQHQRQSAENSSSASVSHSNNTSNSANLKIKTVFSRLWHGHGITNSNSSSAHHSSTTRSSTAKPTHPVTERSVSNASLKICPVSNKPNSSYNALKLNPVLEPGEKLPTDRKVSGLL